MARKGSGDSLAEFYKNSKRAIAHGGDRPPALALAASVRRHAEIMSIGGEKFCPSAVRPLSVGGPAPVTAAELFRRRVRGQNFGPYFVGPKFRPAPSRL